MAEAKKGKGFFALDVDQFFKIQDKGFGIEEAAAYLALMKGTDQTNTISRGGINSVMEYTGLVRSEAKKAIDNLAKADLVEKLDVERARAKTVPRYKLPSHETRIPLAPREASIVADIEGGVQPSTTSARNAATRAHQKGWVEKLSTGWAVVPASQRIAFIPNMFVDIPSHTSPLRRLVQIGEIGPMMLSAELYHKQNLMDHRGVPLADVSAHYSSQKSIMAGSSPSGYRLHALASGKSYQENGQEKSLARAYRPGRFRHCQETFWADLDALEAAHIIEWAIYSANGKPDGDKCAFNRPQRPLGVLRGSKHVRNTPEAGAAFVSFLIWCEQHQITKSYERLTIEEIRRLWQKDAPIIAIENAHVSHVEGIGILRMTYRADTENTAQWLRDRHKEQGDALFFLNEVFKAAFPEIDLKQYFK